MWGESLTHSDNWGKTSNLKSVNNADNDERYHDGVITHLETDILEREVKWALGSITMNKASGGIEFQLSYFKSK